MKWQLCFVLCNFLFQVSTGVPAVFVPKTAEDSVDHFIRDVNTGFGDPHIVGGKEVEPHSHPYQVALILNPDIDQGFCGAALISDQWVVSAAHCTHFPNFDFWSLRLGAHKIREEEKTTQTVHVEKVTLHPGWNSEFLVNDISLLRLSSPAKLDKYVQPINLPSATQKNWSFWYYQVTMTGWGYASDENKTVSPTLRAVESRIITNWYCWIMYRFSAIKDTNICSSGSDAKGHCNGDSGGPMIIKESDGTHTLIGIQSFGVNMGCEKSWPSVSTRLTSYLDWIHSTTGIPIRP